MEITNPEKFAQKQHLASSAGELYKLIRKYGVTPFDGIEIKFISETVASTSELNSNDRVIYCSNGNDAAVGQFLLERDNGSSKTYYVSWPMDYPANASPTQKIDRRWRKNFYESASDQKPWQDRMFVATNGYILWGEVSNISGGGSAGGGSFLTFDGLLIGKPTIVSGGEITSGDEILLANGSSSRSFILHGKRPNPSTGQIDDLYWDTWSDASGLRPSSSYNDSIKQARKDYLFMSTVGYVVEGEFVNIDELSTKIAANKVAISSNKNHISVLEDYNGTIVDPHVNNVHAHNRILNVNKLDIVYNGMTIERDVAAALCGQYLVYDGQNAYNGIINASIDTNGTALHQFYIGTQNLTKGPTVLANKVVLLHRSYSISNKVWSNWEYWSKESEGYNALDARIAANASSISGLSTTMAKDYATKAALDANGVHFFNDIFSEDVDVEETGCTLDAGDKIYFHTEKKIFLAEHADETIPGMRGDVKYYSVFQNADGSIDSASYNNATSIRSDRFFVSDKGYIANGVLYAPDLAQFEQDLHDWVIDQNYATNEWLDEEINEHGYFKFERIESGDIEVVKSSRTYNPESDEIVFYTNGGCFVLHQDGKYYNRWTDGSGYRSSSTYNDGDDTDEPYVNESRLFVSADGYIVGGNLFSVEQFEKNLEAWVTRQGYAKQTDLDTAKRDIKNLETEVLNIWSELDIDDVQSTVGGINERVTNNENNITLLEGRMTTAEGKITTVEGKQTTLQGQFDSMSATWAATINDHDRRIGVLDAQTRTNTVDIAGLKGRTSTLETKVEEIASSALKREFVTHLPTDKSKIKRNTIYLVPAAGSPETDDYDYCDEYIYDFEREHYERIGRSRVDMKNYVKMADHNRFVACLSGLKLNLGSDFTNDDGELVVPLTLKINQHILIIPDTAQQVLPGDYIAIRYDDDEDGETVYPNVQYETGSCEKLTLSLGNRQTHSYPVCLHIVDGEECLHVMTEADVDEIFANLV